MQSLLIFLGTICLTTLFLLGLFNYRTRVRIARYSIKPQYHVADPLFRRSIAGVLAADFSEGNSIQTLLDGKEIFPAMLEAIKHAQKSITLESFICSSGSVCHTFIAALSERARAGVKVHVLLDWMGSNELHDHHFSLMQAAGIQVVKYRKLHWYTLPRINYRSHRKILVVDGTIGFTGGVGIADQWLYTKNGMSPWRDIHYRIEGPVVAKMQATFLDNWLKSHRSVLEGEAYFPELKLRGPISTQLFTSSADGIEAVRLMYLLSIACAKSHIRILNAYFVPDVSFVYALTRAAYRGVTIEILVPGIMTDQRILREVSRSSWKKLLQAGIKIYEYKPTMHHGKLLIVDDLWVSIGSANCDGRSFAMNDEMNLNILDADFAKEQIAIFEEDKKHSHLITYQGWKKRGKLSKLIGNIGKLILGQF